ncbi:MAG TPA: TolC family protein [Cyclobacteriaceae bacterium]|jgi:outer membrane protein TolC|nr:TolC family protein [Cyclobacteriaceae bacterium]
MVRILLLLLIGITCNAQVLTIEQCYELAKQNYPLTRQRDLLVRSNEYSINNIAKGNWPQLLVSGQESYQSEVVKLPFPESPQIPKNQYRIYGEVSQPLTDLITTHRQKEVQQANTLSQVQNLEVELFKLKERIDQLYFGILLLNEQAIQNEFLKKDIRNGLERVNAAIANGIDNQTSANQLKAELLKAEQRDIDLAFSKKSFLDMLGLLIHQQLNEQTTLQWPVEVEAASQINRPELKLFDFQSQILDQQMKLINTKTLPKFSLFLQGGWGQPSPLNLVNATLTGYYIGGVRLNWMINNFYTIKNEKKVMELNKEIITTQRETFLLNTQQTITKQNSEIGKLKQLLQKDAEIVELLSSVKKTSADQLQNGVITSHDYVREVNAEDLAKQNAALHKVQLAMAQYNLKTTSGN